MLLQIFGFLDPEWNLAVSPQWETDLVRDVSRGVGCSLAALSILASQCPVLLLRNSALPKQRGAGRSQGLWRCREFSAPVVIGVTWYFEQILIFFLHKVFPMYAQFDLQTVRGNKEKRRIPRLSPFHPLIYFRGSNEPPLNQSITWQPLRHLKISEQS